MFLHQFGWFSVGSYIVYKQMLRLKEIPTLFKLRYMDRFNVKLKQRAGGDLIYHSTTSLIPMLPNFGEEYVSQIYH